MSKGSGRRGSQVPVKQYNDNHDRIFNRGKDNVTTQPERRSQKTHDEEKA